jgi:hypothetical protein
VVLATNAEDAEGCRQVVAATDRTTRFLTPGRDDGKDRAARGRKILARREVVGLPLGNGTAAAADHLLNELGRDAPILPVCRLTAPVLDQGRRQRVYVFAGPLLPAGTPAEVVRKELQHLDENFRRQAGEGLSAERALSGIH